MNGIFLNPAESESGKSYADIGPNNQLRIELTNINPEATTVIDDVFTISNANNRSRVWIEHDAEDAVTFYRMDTRETIGGEDNKVRLDRGETVHVGLKVVSDSERVVLTEIRIRAEIHTTATTVTPSPPATTEPGTATPVPTSATPTATVTTPTPTPETGTATTGTTTSPTTTSEGETTPETTTQTPTAETPTDTPTTTSGTTAPPGTQPSPDGTEAATPTATEPDGTQEPAPTPVEALTTAPPVGEQPGNVTVETPTDDDTIEVGGFPLSQLGLLAALLAALSLPLLAWWLFGSSAGITFRTRDGSDLDVRPADLDPDWYDTLDDGFRFRPAASEPWVEAAGGSVTFDRTMTIENSGSESLDVSASSADDEFDESQLITDGLDLTETTATLTPEEKIDVTLTLSDGFDVDSDVTVWFESSPAE